MSSTANKLRPRHNPLLWASIFPSANPPTGDSREDHIPSIPIVPENKINTSLRVVLHDTKATLEQFSDRLENLVDGVEQSKRDIDKVNKNFDETHDKMLDELNAVINRSQKGLLEVLGTPAQTATLEDVKNTQVTSDRRLDALEHRTDLVHKQLQALSEQQGHLLTQQGYILTQQGDILTSLATIAPLVSLLKDSPQHQTQILASLTALMPLLPLLQALPAQVKASQQEVLDLFTNSIEIDRFAALSSPEPPKHSALQTTASSSEVPQNHVFDHRHFSETNAQEEHQSGSKDTAAWNTPQQLAAILPSSPTLSREASLPTFGRRPLAHQSRTGLPSNCSSQNLLPSSDIHAGFSSLAKSAALPISEVPTKDRKRRRLEENSDGDIPQNDILASDARTPTIPSSSTLRSDTSESAVATTRCITRSRSFRVPALPSTTSASSHGPPVPATTSSVPTPHAPGSFVQPRSTIPGRLLASTSHHLNRTPTPPPRMYYNRRQTKNGRNLVSSNTFAPSSPPFAHHHNAPELSPPNALNDIQAYVSSESSAHQPLISRNVQPKIIVDKNTEIELDWGDIASG